MCNNLVRNPSCITANPGRVKLNAAMKAFLLRRSGRRRLARFSVLTARKRGFRRLAVDRGFPQPSGRVGSGCPVRLDQIQRGFGFYNQTEETVFGYGNVLASSQT